MLHSQLEILANLQLSVHQLNSPLTRCSLDAHMEPQSEISHTLGYIKTHLKPMFKGDVSLILVMQNNAIAWDTVKEQTPFTHRNYNLVSVKILASYQGFTLPCNLLMLLHQLHPLQLQQIMLLEPLLLQDTPRPQLLRAIP